MPITSTQNTFAPTESVTPTTLRFAPNLGIKAHVAVIGAGAFGGWTALYLLRKGIKVTLIDAWGAGNSRSSSGDETRVIRSTYGANETYFDLNVRALELWKENQERFGKKLFHPTGVLWFCYEEHVPMIDESVPFMQKYGLNYQYLTTHELHQKYPHIHTDDLHHALFDPEGGYLKAREGAIAVQEAFVNEGGTYLQAHVQPGPCVGGQMEHLLLSDGSRVQADAYVFACGSWLGKLFPEVLGSVITCSRQEAYYFGVPYTHTQLFDQMPVWVDVDGQDFYYGIPGNANRGFKIGVDRRGEVFDPTNGERILNPDVLAHARQFITHRFPALRNAPLAENRVCPYENSPDGNFILDQHPEADNCWLLGGGSGHGYKHGPALGELVTEVLTGHKPLVPLFMLERLFTK
ncbi:MAG: FAD-dependent oxidoreductase [Spirosomataceae bacterium]